VSDDPASVADAITLAEVEMRDGQNYAIVPVGEVIDAARLLRDRADTTNRLADDPWYDLYQAMAVRAEAAEARLSALTDAIAMHELRCEELRNEHYTDDPYSQSAVDLSPANDELYAAAAAAVQPPDGTPLPDNRVRTGAYTAVAPDSTPQPTCPDCPDCPQWCDGKADNTPPPSVCPTCGSNKREVIHPPVNGFDGCDPQNPDSWHQR
jgi:hypothetical protein